MRKIASYILPFPTILLTLFPSPDFSTMGHLLEDNSRAIRLIDVPLSNLPSEPKATTDTANVNTVVKEGNAEHGQAISSGLKAELSALYAEAVKQDYEANLSYLQGDYPKTYTLLKASQVKLVEISRRLLENYREDTLALLRQSAPLIIRSGDRSARALLDRGYRELEAARQLHMRAYNIHPRRIADQLELYTDGINTIRRSRRFGLLSLIAARMPDEEKKKFIPLTVNEAKQTSDYREDVSDYDKTRLAIDNLVKRQIIQPALEDKESQRRILLLEVLEDNFKKYIPGHASILLELTLGREATEKKGQ